MKVFLALVAATATLSTPKDFAYRMQVTGTAEASAYRVTVPLAVYQKVVHPDLADVRVFNGNAEQVPFAIGRPVAGTVANAAVALSIFPLKDDSVATLDALRVTIESGKGAVNVQTTSGRAAQGGRINSYLVDGRAVDVLVAALHLEWPQDAADFAGRIRVEASDSLSDWQVVARAAPIANLHSSADRLVEQRVEFAPVKAKFWRLSWVGQAAPFALTAILGEPAKRSVDALHASMTVPAAPAKGSSAKVTPGEFEFDLGATPPVDRVNLELPEINTVVDVELLSRGRPQDTWHTVRRSGFYRLKGDGVELRNGPVSVSPTTDRYWLVHTDPRQGGLGTAAPRLVVEWIPHEVVFVARGAGPFYLAYGSSAARSAAASLSLLPKNLAIAPASLSSSELSGGESLLQPVAAPFPWRTPLLWAVLIAGAGLLAWMALRLSKDLSPK
ncbi:MAG: DUF3999 domain-containing protein [Proteobacteria bacterium]|nr:DUF3999 domain-containing protein [Pseudomonadota bacterium]